MITPSYKDPINEDDLLQHLRLIPEDEQERKYMVDLMKSAVAYLQQDTGYLLGQATYKLTLSDFPDDEVSLPLIPVQSISQVLYYTSKTDTSTLTQNTDFWFVSHDRSASLHPIDSWPSVYDRPDGVQITFVAGHQKIEDVKENALQAIRFLVGHWFENRQAVVTGPIVNDVPFTYSALANQLKRYTF